MGVPSNKDMALLALKIAKEIWGDRGCAFCGAHGNELHEILGRTMRPQLGAVVAILGSTCIPLCNLCHRDWERKTTDEQIIMLNDVWTWGELTALQLSALKSQWNKAGIGV